MNYIPFSQRNDLPNEKFGIIADYLERVLGWNLGFKIVDAYHYFTDYNENESTSYKNLLGIIHYEGSQSWEVYFLGNNGNQPIFDKMPFDVFFASHTTILPAIRDFLENDTPQV